MRYRTKKIPFLSRKILGKVTVDNVVKLTIYQIVNSKYRGEKGVHMTQPTEFHLRGCIQTALLSNVHEIYIHSNDRHYGDLVEKLLS